MSNDQKASNDLTHNLRLEFMPLLINKFYIPDLRHGLEFNCNQQTLLDWGVKPLIDFNAFALYIQFID